MKTSIRSFQQAVSGKTIALVGNAQSILNSNKGTEIDSCDLVVRMNSGFVLAPECQGSRTDVVFTSIPIPLIDLLSRFAPEIVVWATSKRSRIPNIYNTQNFDFCLHPLLSWWALRIQLGSRPSTGAIAAHFLAASCRPKLVRTFGFDHFKSKTFYETRTDIGPHSANSEEQFFAKLYRTGRFQQS